MCGTHLSVSLVPSPAMAGLPNVRHNSVSVMVPIHQVVRHFSMQQNYVENRYICTVISCGVYHSFRAEEGIHQVAAFGDRK